jgi:CheY-like chemotaxis protein
MRRNICDLLVKADPEYTCEQAADGAMALKLAGQIGPDLIISDLNMPTLDGRSLVRFIRQNPRLRTTPFIMVTTEGERDTRIELLQTGVDDYLTKPVDPAELTARVASLLRLRRTALELEKKNRELEASRDREVLSQKAAFAGRLAIGLAHEFNNPIACINSNLSYLAERLSEVAPLVPSDAVPDWGGFVSEAEEIFAASRRALVRMSATVSELQALRGSSDLEKLGESTSVASILDSTMAALSSTMDQAIAVERHLEADPSITVSSLEVGMAFAHLVRFFARRGADRSERQRVCIRSTREAPDAVIRISAPNIELSSEELAHLFDPNLVVSDEKRVRLSVDLSVSAGYIARSGGTVRAMQSSSDGAVFEVRFPENPDLRQRSPRTTVPGDLTL